MSPLKAEAAAGVMTCECGNRCDLEGFYPCDISGRREAPSDLVCCDRCGRIVERATGRSIGYRSFVSPPSEDQALGS